MSRWPKVKLGHVLEPAQRPEVVDATREYRLLGVRLESRGPFLREIKTGAETSAKTLFRVRAGDFIYSRLFAWRGAFGVIPPQLDGCYVSNEFPIFVSREGGVDPQYLNYWLRLPAILERIAVDCTGSTPLTRNRYKERFFLELEMPLPPIEEQRRVVEKLNRLAILQDRAKRASLGNTAAIGLLPTRLRSVRFAALAARLQPVPLGSIGEVRLGKMLSGNRTDSEDGIPYLRNANVQWDFLDLTSVYRMQLPKEQVATYSLRPGDVLVCEGGDIGKAAIWSGEIDLCLFQKALHRIRLDQSLVAPRFLLHHIMWCAESGQFADVKTQTTIAHLTGVQLKAHPLLLPSIHEQQKMVHDLDRVTRLVDRARRSATAASEATVALKCSALAGVLGD